MTEFQGTRQRGVAENHGRALTLFQLWQGSTDGGLRACPRSSASHPSSRRDGGAACRGRSSECPRGALAGLLGLPLAALIRSSVPFTSSGACSSASVIDRSVIFSALTWRRAAWVSGEVARVRTAVRSAEPTTDAAGWRRRLGSVRRRASARSGPRESGRCVLASARSRQRRPRSVPGLRR
jgi:hypothetical protein